MFKISPLRKRQVIGGSIGLVIGILIFVFLSLDSSEEYVSLGPMNTGHEEISCVTCHADAEGNLSQQLQTNLTYMVVGTKDVKAKNCLECHDRPNDRHPTYSFTEPRFKDAVKNIDVTTCITCHSEHHGERVTIPKANYCFNCHQDLAVEEDPLDISHEELGKLEADFHGNHTYHVPEKMKDTIPLKIIDAYLRGGEDPFGTNKKYYGLSEPEWIKTLDK